MNTDANGAGGPDRIDRLREQIMQRKGSFVVDPTPLHRAAALIKAVRPGRSRVEVRAHMLRELVELAETQFPPGWTLAGEHLPHNSRFQGSVDDRAAEFSALGIDDLDHARRVVAAWISKPGEHRTSVDFGSQASDSEACAWGTTANQTVYWAIGWIENHSIRDYALQLRVGFRALRDQLNSLLRETRVDDPDFPRREHQWIAMRTVCEAGIALGRRWGEAAAAAAAASQDPAERARLQQMAETCARVPAEGARTLREAVQSLWLGHILTCGEDGINANSLGRVDQILNPYYEADLAAGRITREEAVELLAELGCKLYLDYDVQAIVLGGQDAAGNDATCEMTWIILDATERVDVIRDLSVRLHNGSPMALYRRAAELILRGGGIPFLFNDACFVPALQRIGITETDARDYAPIGCIELTIPGKANPHAVSGWFNMTKCVELAIFGGIDPTSGRQVGPPTGTLADHISFDALLDAVQKQVEALSRLMVYNINRGELAQREFGPLPAWSLLTADCIGRGRDITNGGALYNYHSICLLGVPDAADALAAIRQLVYDTQEVRPGQLLDALRANWNGFEDLRRRAAETCPKYGNDIASVDDLAADLSRRFIALMDEARSPLGGRYAVHLFTFKVNIDFGKMVGALPDGRRAGEPLAYSLSAHQGRDRSGATAFLNSLARMPHHLAAGATAAIVDLDPASVQGPAGIDRLVALIRGAFSMGVGQLQWNIVDEARLRKAQQDPEHYGNIPVRVAGYSQLFRMIDPALQEHIIARTKHVH
jgi:formate C-acetyltransferase